MPGSLTVPVFQNAAFGGSGPQPRDMLWALPYSIFIFTYDEVRKLLMRKTGGQQREGCLYEYTVRLAHPLIFPRLIPLAVLSRLLCFLPLTEGFATVLVIFLQWRDKYNVYVSSTSFYFFPPYSYPPPCRVCAVCAVGGCC